MPGRLFNNEVSAMPDRYAAWLVFKAKIYTDRTPKEYQNWIITGLTGEQYIHEIDKFLSTERPLPNIMRPYKLDVIFIDFLAISVYNRLDRENLILTKSSLTEIDVLYFPSRIHIIMTQVSKFYDYFD